MLGFFVLLLPVLAVEILNAKYTIVPPLRPKRFIDPKDKSTKYAIELDETTMQKIFDTLTQKQGRSLTKV